MGKVIDLLAARQTASRYAEKMGGSIAAAASQAELDELDEELRLAPAALANSVIARLDAELARRRRVLRSLASDGGHAA